MKRRKRTGVYLYPDDPDVIEFDEDRAAVRIAAGARVTRGFAPIARAHLRSQTSIEVGGCYVIIENHVSCLLSLPSQREFAFHSNANRERLVMHSVLTDNQTYLLLQITALSEEQHLLDTLSQTLAPPRHSREHIDHPERKPAAVLSVLNDLMQTFDAQTERFRELQYSAAKQIEKRGEYLATSDRFEALHAVQDNMLAQFNDLFNAIRTEAQRAASHVILTASDVEIMGILNMPPVGPYNVVMAALSRVCFSDFEQPLFRTFGPNIPLTNRVQRRKDAFQAFETDRCDSLQFHHWIDHAVAVLKHHYRMVFTADLDYSPMFQKAWRLHHLSQAVDSPIEIIWACQGVSLPTMWPGWCNTNGNIVYPLACAFNE